MNPSPAPRAGAPDGPARPAFPSGAGGSPFPDPPSHPSQAPSPGSAPGAPYSGVWPAMHAARGRANSASPDSDLFQVLRKVLVHFEHADLVLAVEDRLELGVGEDLALVGGILQIVLLDVGPDLRHGIAP